MVLCDVVFSFFSNSTSLGILGESVLRESQKKTYSVSTVETRARAWRSIGLCYIMAICYVSMARVYFNYLLFSIH